MAKINKQDPENTLTYSEHLKFTKYMYLQHVNISILHSYELQI